MPDPVRLQTLLRQAIVAFRATPGRVGRFTQLPKDVEVLVAGDMHGNVDNFRKLLNIAQLSQNPNRHLVLQEIIHGPFYYPNGGDKSHQMLDLLAVLKCQFPKNVHFLLGNHEFAQWQNQRIGKGDVDQNAAFLAGVKEAYGNHADAIYALYLQLFAVSEFALATSNRVFLCHTVPNEKAMDAFDFALLKSDGFEMKDVKLGGTFHSIVWGRDQQQATIDAFLTKVDADWIITGHIPCRKEGYAVPNTKQIILDSLGSPACYCLFRTDKPMTQAELVAGIGEL